ncbi:hypothetical protein ACL9RL_09995 [Plantibacter sp. Mn2098]|uniref:hypothetical protein n=1 Tax=Plantibacter sp. Mn2098 TaxID=3395266 RepID=UPI003BD9F5C6
MISRLGFGIALALALTGCTESADLNSAEQVIHNEASAAQRKALVDGVVTSNEYYDAFLRFSACVSAAGFEIESQMGSDQTIDFHVSSASGNDESRP